MNTLTCNFTVVASLVIDNAWRALLVIGAGLALANAADAEAGARQWLAATPPQNSPFVPDSSIHSQ